MIKTQSQSILNKPRE